MYNIAICDDNGLFIQYMKRIIRTVGLTENEVTYYEFSSGEDLSAHLQDGITYDLLILDMQMHKMDGKETARKFRKFFPSTTLVFCSGACLPDVKTFEVMPYRYLLKEYTDEHMQKEMTVVLREMRNKKREPYVVGNYYYSSIRLRPNHILYIAIAKRGSTIYLSPNCKEYETQKTYAAKERVLILYQRLRDFGFAYAHNSYIVNLKYVVKMDLTELELVEGTKLSISRSKAPALREDFAKFLARKY